MKEENQQKSHQPCSYLYEVAGFVISNLQGLKKVPSGCLGQVDVPVGQVTFHSHLPNEQGSRQIICQLNCKKRSIRLAQGKQNLRATFPKGKLEFKFFLSPDLVVQK